jgi:hypothetical protein
MAQSEWMDLVAMSDGVQDDLKMLPNRELQELAIRLIRDLVLGKVRGPELGEGPVSMVPMPGVRRVYFDTLQERQMGRVAWRLVYKELKPNGVDRRARIHVIAIGSRLGLEVYDIARQRLAAAIGQGWSPRPRAPQDRPNPAVEKARPRHTSGQLEPPQQHHEPGQQPGQQPGHGGPAPQM